MQCHIIQHIATYLDNVIDVRNEAVHSYFDQHDECPAYILTYLSIIIRGQEK